MDLRKMQAAFHECSKAEDYLDLVAWPSYEEYVKSCAWWGITPLPERKPIGDDH